MRFSPPPRQVPLSLRVVNTFNGIAQIGWAIFGFSMIFFWTFAWNADFSFINFREPLQRTAGRVTAVESTGASENRRTITRHRYHYYVDGDSYDGTSYTTGQELQNGDQVQIEYKAGDPSRSRIMGMRRGEFGPFVLFVVIFPLAGLGILVPSTRVGRKRTYLLRCGVLTTGVLKSKRATNVTVNNRRVFALTFEFTARDGRHFETEAKSSQPQKLEDEAQEPLLYDPDNPSIAYLLDDAPARPKMEMNGDLIGRPLAAMASVILPILVAGTNTLVVLLKLKML